MTLQKVQHLIEIGNFGILKREKGLGLRKKKVVTLAGLEPATFRTGI